MARFDDSPDLFGCGTGSSTYRDIACEFCGKEYGGREDEKGIPFSDNVAIGFTEFAGLEVCDCCYERIEDEILRRMRDVIPWFIKILESRKLDFERNERMITELKKILSGKKGGKWAV